MTNKPLQFTCGKSMRNRFMLAPLTNQQSNDNGTLTNDELHWLSLRAKGGFGLVMTCASHVQEIGKGFPGQLGCFSDHLSEGHKRLTTRIKSYDSLAVIQLHHAGMRAPYELIETKAVCPSNNDKHNARALDIKEIHELRTDFINAAIRAKSWGYDGVEVHGAHGYILTQFLSATINKRTDCYGGSLENRSRLIVEIIDGIRMACGTDFLVGIRLSPERYGMQLDEVLTLSQQLINTGNIDFLDLSLWDYNKSPEAYPNSNKTLLNHIMQLELKDVKLTVAGNIRSGQDVQKVLEAGVDFVSIGKSAILHHDFANKVMAHSDFIPVSTPVTKAYLKTQGLNDTFIKYMSRWDGFVIS